LVHSSCHSSNMDPYRKCLAAVDLAAGPLGDDGAAPNGAAEPHVTRGRSARRRVGASSASAGSAASGSGCPARAAGRPAGTSTARPRSLRPSRRRFSATRHPCCRPRPPLVHDPGGLTSGRCPRSFGGYRRHRPEGRAPQHRDQCGPSPTAPAPLVPRATGCLKNWLDSKQSTTRTTASPPNQPPPAPVTSDSHVPPDGSLEPEWLKKNETDATLRLGGPPSPPSDLIVPPPASAQFARASRASRCLPARAAVAAMGACCHVGRGPGANCENGPSTAGQENERRRWSPRNRWRRGPFAERGAAALRIRPPDRCQRPMGLYCALPLALAIHFLFGSLLWFRPWSPDWRAPSSRCRTRRTLNSGPDVIPSCPVPYSSCASPSGLPPAGPHPVPRRCQAGAAARRSGPGIPPRRAPPGPWGAVASLDREAKIPVRLASHGDGNRR